MVKFLLKKNKNKNEYARMIKEYRFMNIMNIQTLVFSNLSKHHTPDRVQLSKSLHGTKK